MKCIIQEKEQAASHSLGEPKEIIVDSIPWEQEGHHGHTYSYHMSKERFERSNHTKYYIYIEDDTKQEDGESRKVLLGTIGYYDFVEFGYEDCLGERKIENTIKELNVSPEQLLATIREPLEQLQAKIREEFSRTEEAHVKKEHQEVLAKYQKAKRDFSLQYGFPAKDYDRCYNVFGQLMDGEYLGRLQQRLKERENMKFESKRFRKEQSQKRFHEYLHSSTNVDYSEEEQIILNKFYKVLAKKYHPDANPGVDTAEEMTLLNKLKRQWNI